MSTGVRQDSGKWLWSCGCGASGEAVGRDVARDDYKQHRRTCSVPSQPGAASVASSIAKENVMPKAQKADKTGTPVKGVKGVKAATGGRKKREQSVSAGQAKEALGRLTKGDTTLLAESKKLGFTHNGPLRAALRALIGVDKYAALMQSKKDDKKAAPAAKKTTAKKVAAAPAKKTTAKKTAKKSSVPSGEVVGEIKAAEVADAPVAVEVTA